MPEIAVTLASLAIFPLSSNWLFVEQIDFYEVSEIPHVQFNTGQIHLVHKTQALETTKSNGLQVHCSTLPITFILRPVSIHKDLLHPDCDILPVFAAKTLAFLLLFVCFFYCFLFHTLCMMVASSPCEKQFSVVEKYR